MSEALFPSLAGQGMISIDCETYDPHLKDQGPGYHRDGFVAGIAIGTEAGFRQYYPLAHEAGGNLPKTKVLNWLKKQLALPVPKVGANLLYDLGYLHFLDIHPEGPFYDIQIAEPLLNENRFNYSLEALSKDYEGGGKIDDELDAWLIDRFGKKNPKSHIWRAPPEIVRPYAIGDIDLPLKIFKKQKIELEKQELWPLFILESKLIPMLLAMRIRGVRVDLDETERMNKELTGVLKKELNKIWKLAKQEVSVWAAKDLAVLFDQIGVQYPLTPKTKQPSVTATFLERCGHPIGEQILEVRQMDKLCGTFLQGCILEAHYKGRIHCQFNQLKGETGGTVSGRFSSSNPNLQFIPVRTEIGKKIRSLFLPDLDQMWWKKDYSQIEYRLMVHDAAGLKLPGAQQIVEIYLKDPKADFHQAVADMTGLDRKKAKTINFGLAYGEGVPKLAAQLGLSIEDAEALLREYHRRAPFMKPLSQGASAEAASRGVIRTLFGRRRRFDAWEITKWNKDGTKDQKVFPHRVPGSRRAFTHKALNARIQGSAADIMKKSMVDVWESGVCDILGVPQLTIHDELDGSKPKGAKAKKALAEVTAIMERTAKLRVPLLVDSGEGINWGSIE